MSPKYTLNKANVEQAGLFIIYVMVGAGFAALIHEVTKFDFGQANSLVTVACSLITMVFHMWATGPRQEVTTTEQTVAQQLDTTVQQ